MNIALKLKEAFLIAQENITPSNTSLNEEVVEKIVTEWIDQKKLWALPWVFTTKWFLITDWNHRLEAMRRLWEKYIPIIILTNEEYEVVARTKKEIPFLVKTPTRTITFKPPEEKSLKDKYFEENKELIKKWKCWAIKWGKYVMVEMF